MRTLRIRLFPIFNKTEQVSYAIQDQTIYILLRLIEKMKTKGKVDKLLVQCAIEIERCQTPLAVTEVRTDRLVTPQTCVLLYH